MLRRNPTPFVLLILVAIGLLPASARAASLRVEFDLSQSRLELLGGQIEIPRDGGVTPGSRVVLEVGTTSESEPGAEAPLAGPAWLEQLELGGHFDAELFGGALQLNGGLAAAQTNRSQGLLSQGLDLVLVSDLRFDVDVETHCSGPSCELLGLETSIIHESVALPGALFSLSQLDVPGAATLSIERDLEINGLIYHLELSGTELRRDAVLPEPSTGLLGGLALLGLGVTRRAPGGSGSQPSRAALRRRATSTAS